MTDVLEAVRATGLLAPGRAVVVLLSGGRDSVCLLDVAVRIAGGGAVRALHVNYGLRDAADQDERFCAELCERLGVALAVHRAGRPEGNVQAWARDVRYAEAERLAGEHGADVATGHTATDQAETILYRLAASPGRRALLGMAPRAGRVVRPLLGVSREDTAAWGRARGLGWRDDATNESDAYARSRVRNGLVPALRAVHPAAERNVVRTAALLRDEAAVLDAAVAQALDGGDRIARERLRDLPPALARLVLIHLAECAAPDGVFVPAAAGRLADVLAAPEGAAVAVEGGIDLVVERDGVSARRHPMVGRGASGVSADTPRAVALESRPAS